MPEKVFFRGDLKVTILRATDLPNADGKDLKSKLEKLMKVEKKKDLSDPYVYVSIDDNKILRTRVKKDDLNPVWNDLFELEVSHEGSDLVFWCYDKNLFDNMDVKLGHAKISLEEIIEKKVIVKRVLDLITPFGKCKPTLEVEIEFQPVDFAKSTFEVLHSYFPLRSSGDVVLYQDACCPSTDLLSSIRVHGEQYKPRSAWNDIADSIEKARKFIYMTGWSLSHTTRLRREEENSECIGDVLKRKAAEGLRVLVLLWDEPFNSEELGNVGVVGTNDEITRTYFSNTKVQCILASRIKTKRGMVENLVSSTSFSHHQKTIILDDIDQTGGLVAYIGGLDITCGRYDDQGHAIFSTLDTKHKGDFYQTFPMIESDTHRGPRQPWHDVHARISGECARDVMTNFTERWTIEAPKEKNRLVDLSAEDEADPAKSLWRTQIFRSISNDAADFNKDKKFGLSAKHGQYYEASIHKAYISAIREADDFIYIENQYFLGSAHSWDFRGTRPQANHLIPVEIAQQICQKIENNKRLSVYIVLPLFPEGDPHAAHIQEILYWQSKTISMMYRRIHKTLRKVGSQAHPCDYLNFFCLGRREKAPKGFVHPPPMHEQAAKMSMQGRAMIYVHSKAMVVDDVYSIIGSANINQRSMDGRRDTEIALGCWEEQDDGRLVDDGAVQALRKALWCEHLGRYEAVFDEPNGIDCVRRVRELSVSNWERYAAQEIDEDNPHLLKYPIRVDSNGDIFPGTVNECFPNTSAKILGSKSTFLPNRLTV